MKFIYQDVIPLTMSLTAYNAFLTGLMVFLKRRQDGGTQYFIANIAILIWGVGLSFMLNNNLPLHVASIWGRIANAGALCIPVLWLDFILTHTNKKSSFQGILNCAYVATFVFFPFVFTDKFIRGFKKVGGLNCIPDPGPVYFLFTALFVLCVVFSFWLFWISIKSTASSELKKDYKWIFGASLYGFIMGSLSFLLVFDITLPQYNLLVMPIWQILLTYAMIRHQAFDAQQIADAFQREKITTLGIMAASLNHEMRNPLYVAQGKIDVYYDGVERGRYQNSDEEKRKANEVIDSVKIQLDRTLDIMQRFSDYARPNAMFKKENVVFEDVFKEAFDLVGHEIKSKNISIKTDFEKELRLTVHRRQFEEILVNLMINACHAMEQKGGELSIRVYQSNNKVILEVSDTGLGISEENLRRIYDPFFTTKGSKGSGLGLYITKQLVEKNGGKISVKSKHDEGTRFLVEFKL